MRKVDKLKQVEKANILAEQRHLKSKGFLKEDQATEFKNATEVDNKIKSKGDELLAIHPVIVYGDWDLNNRDTKAAQERLNNPNKFESLDIIKTINNWDSEALKQGKFGPTVYFKPSNGGLDKRVVVTLKGVESNLLSKGHEWITKDGFHSIITIMKNTIDASNDFTPEEKERLLQLVISEFRGFILKK
jgi:hypothetical protein